MRFSPTENRTRGCVQCSVAGNPGSLGMTKFKAVAHLGSGGGGMDRVNQKANLDEYDFRPLLRDPPLAEFFCSL